MLTQCSGDVIITHCNAGQLLIMYEDTSICITDCVSIIIGIEVAHVASILNGDGRIITYGVPPVQVESLTRKLQSQHIDSIL